MANPTTNFGWQMPTSTDLVTDLPADFEVFGQAVDTTLVDLKGGTTGQVLSKASNTDMDFTWATAGGGGKVLQVVYGSSSTQTAIATTTYTDTTLSATITPSATSSKILILIQQIVEYTRSSASQGVGIKILRGSTDIFTPTPGRYEAAYMASAVTVDNLATIPLHYLDSPSTTSATTYKTQAAPFSASSGSITAQPGSSVSTIILLEIGA